MDTLLSDLMMGGLDVRRHSNLKVPVSLLILPVFAIMNMIPLSSKNNFIKFKTHEELSKQPQKTITEYLEENEEPDPGMTTRYRVHLIDKNYFETDVTLVLKIQRNFYY